MHGVPVECAENELARFPPPSGQTCQSYTQQFIQRMGGYVRERDGMCLLCQYANGDEFVSVSPIKLDLQGPLFSDAPFRRPGSTHSIRGNGWTLVSCGHSASLISLRYSSALGSIWVEQERSKGR